MHSLIVKKKKRHNNSAERIIQKVSVDIMF